MVLTSAGNRQASARLLSDRLECTAAWLDGRPWLVLLGCLLLLSAATIPHAATRPFWYDELFTVELSDLPRFSLILDALSDGVDAQPPVLYIATRAARSAFGTSELATRAPALAGVALLAACLFWFVSRRTSPLWGAVTVLMMMASGAFPYAYEARPYGLYLGFSAMALLSWQVAVESRFRKLSIAGLWLSLTLAISSHYYAVLVLLPLLLGESVRTLRNRRLDWPVLLSIVLAAPVILFYLPLIQGGVSLTTHVAFPAKINVLWGTYEFILAQAAAPLGFTLVAVLLVAEVAGESRPALPGLSLPETLACLGFLVLPLPGYLMARAGGLELTERYLLPVVIGLAVLATCGLSKAAKRRTASAALFILVLGGWFAGRNAYDLRMSGLRRPGPFDVPYVTGADGLPLVVANPVTFLHYRYYGTPAVASQAVYVAEPELALKYCGTDTMDRNLQQAKPYFSLPLITWQQLRQQYPRFRMITSAGPFIWLPDRIKAEGGRMTVLSMVGSALVLEVDWNGLSGQQVLSSATQ